MFNDLVTKMIQDGLVADTPLNVELNGLDVQVVEPEDRFEVGHDLGDAHDDVGALLKSHIIKFEIYLKA